MLRTHSSHNSDNLCNWLSVTSIKGSLSKHDIKHDFIGKLRIPEPRGGAT